MGYVASTLLHLIEFECFFFLFLHASFLKACQSRANMSLKKTNLTTLVFLREQKKICGIRKAKANVKFKVEELLKNSILIWFPSSNFSDI